MKKLLLFALILGGFGAFAQTSVGIKAGPSYTVTQGNLKNDYGNGAARFHAGVFSREKMGKISVLVEANYVNTAVGRLSVNYISIPVMLEVGNKVAFQFGISPNLALSKVMIAEKGKYIKGINVDAAAGIRYQINDKFGVNARYSVPLMNYSNNYTRYYAPMNVSLSLNYTLKTFM